MSPAISRTASRKPRQAFVAAGALFFDADNVRWRYVRQRARAVCSSHRVAGARRDVVEKYRTQVSGHGGIVGDQLIPFSGTNQGVDHGDRTTPSCSIC